ncbi:hypothetical protein Tco_1078687 [Tanacetum coccineum]|uniref:Uncharacterized protein n=1 Tax=Tanacetum coccineum TaxID=301880 RepID=A0ABQ5HR92_9ASTR
MQELAEIIQAMLANNNIQDIPEVIRAFVNNNEATKKHKHEDNLRKWSEVIDVDALPDNVEPTNVPKTEETTAEQHVVASDNNNVTNLTFQEPEIDDEDIPMAPFKRKKKDQIKITGRTRLWFYEDSSDQEEDLDEDESDQEEDLC